MKLTTLTSTIALLATPALAGGPGDYGKPIQPPASGPVTATGGDAHSIANARAASASNSKASVVVNVAAPQPTGTTGGAGVGAASPGRGVSGGAHVHAAHQAATAPVYVSTGVTTAARAPDVVVPGGGGFDCPTVGFGASGAGLTGGGGFGPSWISSRCDHRKYAMDVIRPLLGEEAALAYLASVEPDVKQFTTQWKASRTTVAPIQPPKPTQPDVCAGMATWTGTELWRHPECRG